MGNRDIVIRFLHCFICLYLSQFLKLFIFINILSNKEIGYCKMVVNTFYTYTRKLECIYFFLLFIFFCCLS